MKMSVYAISTRSMTLTMVVFVNIKNPSSLKEERRQRIQQRKLGEWIADD